MSSNYNLAGQGSELFKRDDAPDKPLSTAEKIRAALGALLLAAYYVLLLGGQYFFDGTSEFYRSLNLFSGTSSGGVPVISALTTLSYI